MKLPPNDIFDIFTELQDLTRGKIVNAQLAEPVDIEKNNVDSIEKAKEIVLQRSQTSRHPRVYIAQFAFALMIFLLEEIYIVHHSNDKKDILNPLPHLVMLMIITLIYEIFIGQLPLQTTIDKLILNQKELHNKQLMLRYVEACSEANRKGPRSGFGMIFNSKKLESIFEKREIPSRIHESIIRALSSLKYKAFECVGITGLTVLKIIKLKRNYTIDWYHKPNNCSDGHNFLVIHTEEKDKFIIDAWYNICTDFSQLEQESGFLYKYPLLSTNDKKILTTIEPKDYQYYKDYIDMLDDQLTYQPRSIKDV